VVHLVLLLLYVRRPGPSGGSIHLSTVITSGTHPRDFVIMTILNGAVDMSPASARL